MLTAGVLAVAMLPLLGPTQAMFAQAPEAAGKKGGGKGGFPKGAPVVLPKEPTAVNRPTISEKITGPGAMFDTGKAHWTNRGPDAYQYVVEEYFISGTANGKPYKTRLALRRPAVNRKFSGLVLTESMHFSGNAHGFGYNSIYLMTSGHIAAEIVVNSLNLFTDFNKERYASLQATPDQASEILAQVGALIRSADGPLKGLAVRKEILWGTSASSAVLAAYLPAHMVFRTPQMKNVYDGFLATSTGGNLLKVDVPIIQVPTQNEYRNGATMTTRADSDTPGEQYRMYEWAGMGHLDSRFDVRLEGACAHPLSAIPLEALMSTSLHYLFQWVDKGIAPPKAPRIEMNGNAMALDENGNPKGGIRSPYLDVPLYTYTAQSPAAQGKTGDAPLLCSLSNYVTPIPPEKQKAMYKDKRGYVKKFEARLKEIEKSGWALPVYHKLVVEDAKRAMAF
jgi:hypothetical protein